jgi:hypothetical protein
MSLEVWFWKVRTLRLRISTCEWSYARTSSSTPPAPQRGSSVTISPLNTVAVVRSSRAPSRISSVAPMSNGLWSIGSPCSDAVLGNDAATVHRSGRRR